MAAGSMCTQSPAFWHLRSNPKKMALASHLGFQCASSCTRWGQWAGSPFRFRFVTRRWQKASPQGPCFVCFEAFSRIFASYFFQRRWTLNPKWYTVFTNGVILHSSSCVSSPCSGWCHVTKPQTESPNLIHCAHFLIALLNISILPTSELWHRVLVLLNRELMRLYLQIEELDEMREKCPWPYTVISVLFSVADSSSLRRSLPTTVKYQQRH